MKSILKLTTVVAFLFSTTMGIAKDPMIVLSKNEEAKSLIFRQDAPGSDAAVRLFDMEGNTIYSEKTGEVAIYSKKFDLAKLPAGTYFFEFEDSFKEILYTIKVGDKDVRIVEKDEKLKPIFRRKGQKLFLNFLNLEESKVEIKVLDSENRVVFEETINGDVIVERAMNFEKAFEDNYTVVVSTEGVTYYENVLVD